MSLNMGLQAQAVASETARIWCALAERLGMFPIKVRNSALAIITLLPVPVFSCLVSVRYDKSVSNEDSGVSSDCDAVQLKCPEI